MVPTMGAKTINHAPTNGVVGDFGEIRSRTVHLHHEFDVVSTVGLTMRY